ncbi:BBP7 family outer membrane beta-barrel protein [Stieleria maiorica]|nr:BBP7 family outer membrane beta-barrel protein [Stieleria maiorica]
MIRNMVNRLTNMNSEAGVSRLPAAKPLSRLRRAGSALVGTSLAVAAAIFATGLLSGEVSAQGYPSAGVSLANYDLAASGFVTPAGVPPIGTPGMMGMSGSPVMPVGYNAYGCDSGNCDALPMQACMDRMVCGTCGGGGGCSCNSFLGGGGVLGKLRNGGSACLFCRGAGCTACKELPFGYAGSCLASAVSLLRPYEEAGICNQRWYDVSLEALFLDRQIKSAGSSVITQRGSGPSGTPVLSLSDDGLDELEAGVRASVAFIWGVGGNVELTYMGGNEWKEGASAQADVIGTNLEGNLYSFLSDFGTIPGAGGFDDTDRSTTQSIEARSRFHSAEFNYRRRTMFPYCRFQSSWLVGLRFMRYDDGLRYATQGQTQTTIGPTTITQNRFFNADADTENRLFGPQAGFDFWWNVVPGISVGLGAKGAWVQNDVDRAVQISANSLATQNAFDGDQRGTILADLELKGIYRLSHSLTLRGSYYVLAVDDIAFGSMDFQVNGATQSIVPGNLAYDSLTLQGFTVGAEYMW